jgi:3'-5' exoribonuclease
MNIAVESGSLGPIDTLSELEGYTGYGTYLLTECAEREGISGQNYLRLTLEDATGRATGFVWPESRGTVNLPPLFTPVSTLSGIQLFDGKPQLRVQCLSAASPDGVIQATRLLPRHRCPAPVQVAFDRLTKLECALPAPLKEFLRRALLDPAIGMPFLRCRASVNHHHAYLGGLLVHSTESLDLIEHAARLVLPSDPYAPHLAQLGYLFHDLGKLRSVGESMRPAYGLAVRHELMTIELLAPHLGWLEQQSLELAVGLRSVFDYLATPFAARRIPRYAVAEVVATLDQWSAAAHGCHDLSNLLRLGRPANAATLHRAPQRHLDSHRGAQQCI